MMMLSTSSAICPAWFTSRWVTTVRVNLNFIFHMFYSWSSLSEKGHPRHRCFRKTWYWRKHWPSLRMTWKSCRRMFLLDWQTANSSRILAVNSRNSRSLEALFLPKDSKLSCQTELVEESTWEPLTLPLTQKNSCKQ
jgi:hypothetical protein